MKPLLFLSFVFASLSVCSQGLDARSISPTIPGLEPVIVEVTGKNASELYQSAYRWVHTSYINPEKVLMANMENEHIRVRALDYYYYNNIGGVQSQIDYYYILEIDFKDGKYQ